MNKQTTMLLEVKGLRELYVDFTYIPSEPEVGAGSMAEDIEVYYMEENNKFFVVDIFDEDWLIEQCIDYYENEDGNYTEYDRIGETRGQWD